MSNHNSSWDKTSELPSGSPLPPTDSPDERVNFILSSFTVRFCNLIDWSLYGRDFVHTCLWHVIMYILSEDKLKTHIFIHIFHTPDTHLQTVPMNRAEQIGHITIRTITVITITQDIQLSLSYSVEFTRESSHEHHMQERVTFTRHYTSRALDTEPTNPYTSRSDQMHEPSTRYVTHRNITITATIWSAVLTLRTRPPNHIIHAKRPSKLTYDMNHPSSYQSHHIIVHPMSLPTP